jgi:hypothetical protein
MSTLLHLMYHRSTTRETGANRKRRLDDDDTVIIAELIAELTKDMSEHKSMVLALQHENTNLQRQISELRSVPTAVAEPRAKKDRMGQINHSPVLQCHAQSGRTFIGGRVEINMGRTDWMMSSAELRAAFAGHTNPMLSRERTRSLYFRSINLPKHDTMHSRGWRCIKLKSQAILDDDVDVSDNSDESDKSDDWDEVEPHEPAAPLPESAATLIEPAAAESSEPAPLKRRPIPKNVRMEVWTTWFGKVWEGRCIVCKHPIDCTDFHVGHVVAQARGGTDHIDNLRPVCAPCNNSMGTQNLDEYCAAYYGRSGCANGQPDSRADGNGPSRT